MQWLSLLRHSALGLMGFLTKRLYAARMGGKNRERWGRLLVCTTFAWKWKGGGSIKVRRICALASGNISNLIVISNIPKAPSLFRMSILCIAIICFSLLNYLRASVQGATGRADLVYPYRH